MECWAQNETLPIKTERGVLGGSGRIWEGYSED
jgi:hypothetical protein